MNKSATMLILLMILSASCVASTAEVQPLVIIIPNNPSISSPSSVEPIAIGEGGLLSGQPCPSPCFYGIHLGETRLNKATSLLAKNGIYGCTQEIDNVSCGNSIFIGIHTPTTMVDGIRYSPSVPIAIGAIINKYGNPGLIQVFYGDVPDVLRVSVILYWDSLDMRIHLPEVAGQYYEIKNTTSIEWVTFFDKNQYLKLTSGNLNRKWNGYGRYTP